MPRLLALAAVALSLLVTAPAAEAAKRRVPQGFFGVMWDRAAASTDPSAQDRQWALMARTGVESVRTVLSWRRIEPRQGAFDFARTDQLVTLAARRGMELLPVVMGTPGWAAVQPADLASQPRDPASYGALMTKLVGRYGRGGDFWAEHPELPRRPVRSWQVWNEPHISSYWRSESEPWAISYVRLLSTANAAIKARDPKATVVAAALANRSWEYVDLLYEAGARDHFDVLAINFFTSRPDLVLRGVRVVRRVATEHGDRRVPIWLTETTWPASRGRIRSPHGGDWPTTERGAAKRLRAFFPLAARHRRKLGLERMFWYTWASAYRESDLFDYGGLLRFDGRTFAPRPVLAAFAAGALRLEGCLKTSRGSCRRR
jgi:hypothetical protein